MKGCLTGVRVVELGGKGPVPFASMMLADMGADVTVCRRPGELRPLEGADLLSRGKRLVERDLKSTAGVAELLDSAEEIDVVLEGFRPGTVERLGVGPSDFQRRNPRLVYVRVSGYGQGNSRSTVVGHDLNFVAMGAALAHIGPAGSPPESPLNLVGDFGGGGMLGLVGVLAALFERERSGLGQVVDVAMTDAVSLLMTNVHGMHAAGMWSDVRGTNLLDGGAPFYRAYQTSDGLFVSVAALEQRQFAELLRVCGVEETEFRAADQHDKSRWPALRERLTAIFATRSRAEWSALFEGVEASFAPALRMSEAFADEYHQERGSFVTVDGIPQPAPAPRFSRTPSRAGRLPEAASRSA